MKQGRKTGLIFALAALLALLLSGCVLQTVDKMYSLPRRSAEESGLQAQINKVLVSADYCTPLAGENQQAVQMVDLDGDGQDEALLFAKGTDEKPLKLYIFHKEDKAYTLSSTLEGVGAAFDRVEYAQVDGSEGMEILIGRQLSDDVLRALSVYSFRSGQAELLTSAVYTSFLTTDLDVNGQRELIVARPGSDSNGVLEYYDWRSGTLERRSQAELSVPVDRLKRLVSGGLSANIRGVFATESYDEQSLLTDVFTLQEGKLVNLTQSAGEGSLRTLCDYEVYPTDLDGDGIIELPLLLEQQSQAAGSLTGRYAIVWCSLREDGALSEKLLTYHNFTDGWYLELPLALKDRLTVSDVGSSGAAALEFRLNSASASKITFTIFAYTGGSWEEADQEQRTLLARTDEIVYAAALTDGWAREGITEEYLKGAFHMLQLDWSMDDLGRGNT